MVTHMGFVSPVFFFFDFVGAVVWGEPCEAVLGSAPAAGPLLLFVSGNLLFFFFFLLFFFFREGKDSELVAAVVPPVAVSDGAAPPAPPPSPPKPVFTDEAAAVGLEGAAAAADEADEDGDEDVARSRAHSSLCPARHAALWQAWLQYFRCRQPEQKCSGWSCEARVWQNAHSSMIAGLFAVKMRPG